MLWRGGGFRRWLGGWKEIRPSNVLQEFAPRGAARARGEGSNGDWFNFTSSPRRIEGDASTSHSVNQAAGSRRPITSLHQVCNLRSGQLGAKLRRAAKLRRDQFLTHF
jgi:hypothetical protein